MILAGTSWVRVCEVSLVSSAQEDIEETYLSAWKGDSRSVPYVAVAMIWARILIFLALLTCRCQGLSSHRPIANIHLLLRGGGDASAESQDTPDINASRKETVTIDRPEAPDEPIAFVDVSVEQQTDDDTGASASPKDQAPAEAKGEHSDIIATVGIKSMVKDAMGSMKSGASKAWNSKGAPVQTLKGALVGMKDNVSIDALKAKTSAISVKALIVNTLVLFGSESKPLTPLSVLSLSLLGASLGFKSYLWFATVGYTVAVGLVSLTALIVYNTMGNNPIPRLANLQTLLVLTWSIRLTAFLIYREYVSWPGLHKKTKEVDQESQEETKLGIWVTCGSFYAAMVAPAVYRLQAGMVDSDRSVKWGVVGKLGILMQFVGLVFEAVADAQKATFKASEGNRGNWCNVGLWYYFSHPNYLGEVTFWVGTYLGGLGCYTALYQFLISTIGIIFLACVMKSATDSLSAQELRRYGMNEEYLEFRRMRGFLGPFKLTRQPEHQILL